jgi:hypothetical protein
MIDISPENKRHLLKMAMAGNKQAAAELKHILQLERPWKIVWHKNDTYYLQESGEKTLISETEFEQMGKKFNIFVFGINNKQS